MNMNISVSHALFSLFREKEKAHQQDHQKDNLITEYTNDIRSHF